MGVFGENCVFGLKTLILTRINTDLHGFFGFFGFGLTRYGKCVFD